MPSEPTKDFQTLQAKPKHAPYNVTVRAMSSSELRVRWIPLQQTEVKLSQLFINSFTNLLLPSTVVWQSKRLQHILQIKRRCY